MVSLGTTILDIIEYQGCPVDWLQQGRKGSGQKRLHRGGRVFAVAEKDVQDQLEVRPGSSAGADGDSWTKSPASNAGKRPSKEESRNQPVASAAIIRASLPSPSGGSGTEPLESGVGPIHRAGLGIRNVISRFSTLSLIAVPAKLMPVIDALPGVWAVQAELEVNALTEP